MSCTFYQCCLCWYNLSRHLYSSDAFDITSVLLNCFILLSVLVSNYRHLRIAPFNVNNVGIHFISLSILQRSKCDSTVWWCSVCHPADSWRLLPVTSLCFHVTRVSAGETGSAAVGEASGHVMTPAALPHHEDCMFWYACTHTHTHTHVQVVPIHHREQHVVSRTNTSLQHHPPPHTHTHTHTHTPPGISRNGLPNNLVSVQK